MTDKQAETAFWAFVALGTTYVILSSPRCQAACRTVFEPLASEAGKILASTLAAALIVR